MRKFAQRKNSFPQDAEACPEKNGFTQNAEACPEEKRLSAKCGNLKAGFAIGLVLRNKLNRQTLQVLLTQNLKDDAQRLLVLGVCTKAKGAAMYTSCLFLLTQKQTLFADCALIVVAFAKRKTFCLLRRVATRIKFPCNKQHVARYRAVRVRKSSIYRISLIWRTAASFAQSAKLER